MTRLQGGFFAQKGSKSRKKGADRLEKSGETKTENRIGSNQLGMLVIALIVLVLLGWLTMESRNLQSRLAVYDARAAELEEQIEDETERTEEIKELKEYMQTDEYAEEVAREKLGLVKENEIVFQEEK